MRLSSAHPVPKMASSVLEFVRYVGQYGVAESWERATHEPEFAAIAVTAVAIPVALLVLVGILWVNLTEEGVPGPGSRARAGDKDKDE